MEQQDRVVHVLSIEDNEGDRRLIREFFRCRTVRCQIDGVSDGAEGLDFLFQRGKYAGAPRPALVLLDWNLPRVTGAEVLKEIKSHPQLKDIPVVVFTTSDAKQDILQGYELHANCYLVKPLDIDAFEKVMEQVEKFWIETAELSPNRAA